MKLATAIAYVAAQNAPTQKSVTHSGMSIAIEHPKGSMREIKNDDGQTVWKKQMQYDYGYIRNTQGRDGDEIDVMMGPLQQCSDAYVIHMVDMGPDVSERQDEDKVMLGFPSAGAARQAFHSHYPPDFYGGMTVVPVSEFKQRAMGKQVANFAV